MNQKIVCCCIMFVSFIAGFSFFGCNVFAEPAIHENVAVQVEVTKGIVNAARLNVRTEPGVNYQVAGRLALNDEISILEQNGDWYRIEKDEIQGWVHGGYIKDLEEQTKIVRKGQQVARGAYISRGEITEVSTSSQRELVTDEAETHLGKPYSYGADGPNAFDCSGLVQYCFQSIGVSVPRSSGDYGSLGNEVSAEQALPGDIVCFNTSGKGISHVGIYLGDGEFIHAASGSRTHKVMINHLSEDYYSARLVTIRNIL